MPWQQHVVDVAFEVDPATGRLAYREVVLTVPRQSGKTQLILPVLTHRCTRFGGRQNVIYTAQSRNAARKKWQDEHVHALEASKLRTSFDVRLSNGSEAILWKNGSKWAIDAPTRTAGHGETLDLGAIDEAFSQVDDRVEGAMSPTMITRPSPQIWVFSTAGDAQSFYLWRKILAGREGKSPVTAYFEWSAEEDADPSLEETWRSCSPALGYTISIDALRAEWLRAQAKGVEGINLFRRAFLNQWPEIPVLGDAPGKWQLIPADPWKECADSDAAPSEPFGFGIDRTPDGAWTSIAVFSGGVGEVIEHRQGTGWVVGRVAELVERWGDAALGFGVDPAGPAGAFIGDLAPILGDKLVKVSPREHAQAAGALVDSVKLGTFRHRDQPDLNLAASCAVKRPYGDAYAFNRQGVSPISPIVALTLARHVAVARASTSVDPLSQLL